MATSMLILNAALGAVLIAGLSYAMSAPARLVPHVASRAVEQAHLEVGHLDFCEATDTRADLPVAA